MCIRDRYRQDRDHKEFLCCLKDRAYSYVDDLISELKNELVKRFYMQSCEAVFHTRSTNRV